MKTLVMPVRSRPATLPAAHAKRHSGMFLNAARYAARHVALMTLALLACLTATIVLASALALALTMIVGLTAAVVIALSFMMVTPEGNLLLLLVFSQLWLLYAPREAVSNPQPDGGLTMETQGSAAWQPPHSLAA